MARSRKEKENNRPTNRMEPFVAATQSRARQPEEQTRDSGTVEMTTFVMTPRGGTTAAEIDLIVTHESAWNNMKESEDSNWTVHRTPGGEVRAIRLRL
jgi:hypothetical protein